MKIATIRLQWNRKRKMMPPAKSCSANISRVKNFIEAAAPAKTKKGFIENVRHVEA
jgi:hypothetical protein